MISRYLSKSICSSCYHQSSSI